VTNTVLVDYIIATRMLILFRTLSSKHGVAGAKLLNFLAH